MHYFSLRDIIGFLKLGENYRDIIKFNNLAADYFSIEALLVKFRLSNHCSTYLIPENPSYYLNFSFANFQFQHRQEMFSLGKGENFCNS